MGEADDQPHIALRDHDGSDRGPGDAAYAVRAGGRLDAQTIRVARSDGEGRDLLYAVNDGAGWTIEAVDPPGRGFICCVCRQMPNRLQEGVLVAMTRLFCSRPWGSG